VRCAEYDASTDQVSTISVLQIRLMPIIRTAQACEASVLTDLARRSKAHWGYDETFMAACMAELTVDQADVRGGMAFVLDLESSLAGFYLLERVRDREIELAALFVEPRWIGRGYGRLLLQHASARSHELGFVSLVIAADPHAAPFYEAMGGVRVGSRASESIAGRELPLFELATQPPAQEPRGSR
jgi:GNAT superfamily N-acetyltransferase